MSTQPSDDEWDRGRVAAAGDRGLERFAIVSTEARSSISR